jgi:hypothetical protein
MQTGLKCTIKFILGIITQMIPATREEYRIQTDKLVDFDPLSGIACSLIPLLVIRGEVVFVNLSLLLPFAISIQILTLCNPTSSRAKR